jgi:hypothetical protein
MKGEWSTPSPDCFIFGNVPVPNVEGAGWAPGHLLVGWLVHEELKNTSKRKVVAYFSYYPRICPEGLR